MFHSLRPRGPLDRPEEIHRAALEGLVAQHLKAWIDNQNERYELFFWQTRSSVEVDFILYGDKGFWAIEVKNSGNITPKDLSGLKSFSVDYPEAKAILLYRGARRILQQNILCLPVEDFLLSLSEMLSI